MADERRYRDDEVREIFDLAVSGDSTGRPPLSDESGLTLAELQEVGVEVGVEPTRIAEAALALDTRRGALPRRMSLGAPVSVGRVVELRGTVTDEWGSIVQELREMLGTRGQLASHGGIREWTDGALHASLEPTDAGHRLHLTISKGGALALNGAGVAALAMGLVLLTLILTTGASPVRMELAMVLLLGIGGGALALNRFTLPRWARDREGQLEYIASRVLAAVEDPSNGGSA